MSDRVRSFPFRTRPALASAALAIALVLGGGWWAVRSRTAGLQSSECRAAQALSASLLPLAKGEVAALVPSETPKPPPDIAFQDPQGRPVTLRDLKGKTVLVNLWATWCVPCRQEMPALDKLQSEQGGEDFQVVAINVDTRNTEKPRAWLQENSIRNLAFYADPSGKVLQVLQRSGHVVGLPTTLLVDRDGCELAVMKGPADWASPDAVALVRRALGQQS